MDSWQKTLFIFCYKIYKLIKYILYKIFIFPFQWFAFVILKFYEKNFLGARQFYKQIYKEKILFFFGMLFVFFFFLKYTHWIFYDPFAFDVEIKWPKRIRILRKRALLHWINLTIIFTFLQLISWIFYRVHLHFKGFGLTLYYDIWFWCHIWFHGIWWDTSVVYMNIGAGQLAVVFFIAFHVWGYWPHQIMEFLEDMEDDWDDYLDEYPDEAQGTYFENSSVEVNEDAKLALNLQHQNLLDEITWDVFGSSTQLGDDPNKVSDRWNLWFTAMYPPELYNDDKFFDMEIELYINRQPWNLWDFYVSWFAEFPTYVTPELCEEWWFYWTVEHPGYLQWAVFPWSKPLQKFYYRTFRAFFALLIPMRRVRAVGEYSRFNWRYKKWLLKFSGLSVYQGKGGHIWEEWKYYVDYFFVLLEYIFLYWWNLVKIHNVRRDWKDIWFTKKYRKQVKQLQKWGSKNYSFFGKKNYKPKK
jgi:hypothetical protein